MGGVDWSALLHHAAPACLLSRLAQVLSSFVKSPRALALERSKEGRAEAGEVEADRLLPRVPITKYLALQVAGAGGARGQEGRALQKGLFPMPWSPLLAPCGGGRKRPGEMRNASWGGRQGVPRRPAPSAWGACC